MGRGSAQFTLLNTFAAFCCDVKELADILSSEIRCHSIVWTSCPSCNTARHGPTGSVIAVLARSLREHSQRSFLFTDRPRDCGFVEIMDWQHRANRGIEPSITSVLQIIFS